MSDAALYKAAESLGGFLEARGLRLALAESCSGGWIAKAVTDIAGSSAWFDCAMVSYSNAAKVQLLGVDQDLLNQYGAVSEPVARAMAGGAIMHSQADVAIAVTGIAGPDGGSVEKPVGLVWFAWALQQNGNIRLKSEPHRFEGARDVVRYRTVEQAMGGMVDWLDEVL